MNPKINHPVPLPEQSLAAVFHETGKPLVLTEIPIPRLERGEALIKIDCCTLCGSDLHSMAGTRSVETPTILGHEITGRVWSIHEHPPTDVHGAPLQMGDRVTWSVAVSCFDCDRCDSGVPQKCRSLSKYGHDVASGRLALSGGLAEYMLLRTGSSVVKVSPDVPDELICPANCATATVAAAFRAASSCQGKRVLIFGAGMLGLTATAWARVHQAKSISVCDISSSRLDLSKKFGASDTHHWDGPHQDLGDLMRSQNIDPEFDILFDFSGSPNAIEQACSMGGVGCQIILVGTVFPTPSVSINPETVVRRLQTIQGIHNYSPNDLLAAVDFLENHSAAFPFRDLVTHTFSLRDVNTALDAAQHDKPIRIAIRPSIVD